MNAVRTSVIAGLLIVAGIGLYDSSAIASDPPATRPATQPSGDYRIAAGDLLRIEVWDLQGSGMSSAIIRRVAHSGTITMPYVNHPLDVAGKTEAELEAMLRKEYREAQVLPQAVVLVNVLEGSDGRTISPGYFNPAASAPPRR